MSSAQVAQVSHWAIKHRQSILSNRLKRGARLGSSLAEQIYRYNLRQRTDIRRNMCLIMPSDPRHALASSCTLSIGPLLFFLTDVPRPSRD